jgi:hypothetical protein
VRGSAPGAVDADDAVAPFETARQYPAQKARGAGDHDRLY